MYYRRKVVLALLQTFGGSLTKMDLQKYLFLFNKEKSDPVYEFLPYHYGCYSFQSNQDLSTLTKYKIVKNTDSHWTVVDKTKYFDQLNASDKNLLLSLHHRFNKLKGDDLVKYVYENNPYYAINSRIAEILLGDEELEKVKSCKPAQNDYTLFTIGYEGKTVEHYSNQLIKENIKVLCDIRKNPISMKYGFSKKQLKHIVENVGIKYLHFPELGIDSNKRQELNSQADYEILFADYDINTLTAQHEWIDKLYSIFLSEKRIALTCFEADHKCCHRSRTAKALYNKFEKDYSVKHL